MNSIANPIKIPRPSPFISRDFATGAGIHGGARGSSTHIAIVG